MQKRQHTRIDDLTTVGHGPAEEHLALAAGGARPMRCWGFCVRDGKAVGDVVADTTA